MIEPTPTSFLRFHSETWEVPEGLLTFITETKSMRRARVLTLGHGDKAVALHVKAVNDAIREKAAQSGEVAFAYSESGLIMGLDFSEGPPKLTNPTD